MLEKINNIKFSCHPSCNLFLLRQTKYFVKKDLFHPFDKIRDIYFTLNGVNFKCFCNL